MKAGAFGFYVLFPKSLSIIEIDFERRRVKFFDFAVIAQTKLKNERIC